MKKVKVGAYVGIKNRAGDEDDAFWVAKVVESRPSNIKHPRRIYEEVAERAEVRGKQIRLGGSVTTLKQCGRCESWGA